jgi:hypothetical protein
MSAELGNWLREQRVARGWARPEMARQLIHAGQARGDRQLPGLDGMCHNIYRWERGGPISERYKLHYCHGFGIQPSQFGPGVLPNGAEESAATATVDAPCSPELTVGQIVPYVSPLPDIPGLPPPGTVAYRGVAEPRLDASIVEREVLMAAHDGSEHAGQADRPGIGDVTMEQLRADLVRLSRQSDTGEPFPVFLDMRRVRARIYSLLDRRLWPREQTDLYFLLGCLNGLMGNIAFRLGYPDAAEELIRAGWAYATAIDHQPLRARLRATLSAIMYWRGSFGESRDLAADGLRYVSEGPPGADLNVFYAKSAARLGDPDAARRAIRDANEARERDYTDDLLDIGGQFTISQATHHCFTGTAFAEIQGAENEAAEELERAIGLYDRGPREGEDHWFAGKPLAGIDLAVVRLRSGALDAATAALEPTLSLPVAQRITQVTNRLMAVRDELAAPIFHGSAQARNLGAQIEEFGRETIVTGLHSLPGPG